MTQNIYDDPEFFHGYSQLPRSVEGLAAAAEWPSIRELLPAMGGLRVVDLGCGYGWFCRWAREAGAERVLGVDVSEKMLARARVDTDDGAITYELHDLEELVLSAAAFDLVYSSLTLHYIRDLPRLLRAARRSLATGGALVFSVEHPIFTAPYLPEFVDDANGRSAWPLTDYLVEGERRTDWITRGVVKQHRSVGSYVNAVIAAGFTLTHLEEWGPSDEQIEDHPDWSLGRDRPPFMLVAAHLA